ncbi:MAG: hypothetical protein QW179_02835 [Candidatus Hadarchaeales archaeon]
MAQENLRRILSKLPTYSKELGLNLHDPKDRFKWFLASILFAKRISTSIAKHTFVEFEKAGLTSPDAILEAGWGRLVEVLDSGGYVRYDFSTASILLESMAALNRLGGLEEIHRRATDPKDLERRLMELKGVGPTAANIFLRELRGIWPKARPAPCPIARKVGKLLGLREIEPHESALVRLHLEFCKKHRCAECPANPSCRRAKPRNQLKT